ncbi:hypothetical protein CEXT_247131 [Caerostris extrusa]|uniref:Uncharacterized protein n=1 Tax=Caerostris extrusa TaxID=172846 RepID=A0AAV4XGW3_CAEEX|nr:hypothetical protein CEXT_247131 [Caerostris extrusa]
MCLIAFFPENFENHRGKSTKNAKQIKGRVSFLVFLEVEQTLGVLPEGEKKRKIEEGGVLRCLLFRFPFQFFSPIPFALFHESG